MTREEALANYEAFTTFLEAEPPVARTGEIALICNQEITAFYPDVETAFETGMETHGAGRFTVQEVRDTPVFFGGVPVTGSAS